MRAYNVLFLCTGNAARSIIAESLMDALGGGRFRGFSAGSHPRGQVHPLALEALSGAGYPIAGARSKSWDEFAQPGAPAIDFVITVCDDAAAEACPIFPGRPVSAHWGLADPASVAGNIDEQRAAFRDTLREMRRRVQQFTSLPFGSTDQKALPALVRQIGS